MLPASISQRFRDILARSRLASRRECDGVEGGADDPDQPFNALCEIKYGVGEVVL